MLAYSRVMVAAGMGGALACRHRTGAADLELSAVRLVLRVVRSQVAVRLAGEAAHDRCDGDCSAPHEAQGRRGSA